MTDIESDQETIARAVLADCIHYTDERCDAAAELLAKSGDHANRMIGQEWLKIRALTAEGKA